MMKKEYTSFLLVFMIFGILLSGCSNTQPKATVKKKSAQYKYVDNNANNNEPHYYKKLGLTRYEYFGGDDNGGPMDLRIYGAYYSGGGGQPPLTIHILVDKSKIESAKKDILKLTNLLVSVKKLPKGYYDSENNYLTTCEANRWYKTFLEDNDNMYIGLNKHVNLENTVCWKAKTYPGMEVSATFALRKLNSILYAIRPGFAAGGEVVAIKTTDFEAKGESYLKKQNQLDNVQLTNNQDNSLKSNYVNKK